MGLGVPVYELYGMTENAAVATLNFHHRVKLGTVGEPYPGIGLRIDEETGEIQTKHEGNFVGYFNNPEATAEAFTEDGINQGREKSEGKDEIGQSGFKQLIPIFTGKEEASKREI